MTDSTPDNASTDASTEAALAPHRERIDAIDRAVVALLNERAACAAEIGRIKHTAGVAVYAPRREEDVIRNVVAANGGPLPAAAVQRLFTAVIDETRSLEREMTGDTGGLHGPPA